MRPHDVLYCRTRGTPTAQLANHRTPKQAGEPSSLAYPAMCDAQAMCSSTHTATCSSHSHFACLAFGGVLSWGGQAVPHTPPC